MESIVVGVADCRVSSDPGARLVTYALGSCIAVTIYDPVARVGGLLHFMLPERAEGAEGGGDSLYRYADTGTPLLFREAYRQGADKKRLLVRLAGGATVFKDNGVFNIGKRNLAAVKRILWKAGVMVHAEDVGGTQSRTVRLEIQTGRLSIQSQGEQERELAIRAARPRQGAPQCPAVC